MSIESQGHLRPSIADRRAAGSKDDFDASSGSPKRDGRDVADLVLRLTSLLRSAPVDLARMGREIRAHPDLEALVMRLAGSLVLYADSAVPSVEEAAVVLGTDRLRVLIYMWSLLPDVPSAAEFPGHSLSQSSDAPGGPSASPGALPAWSPETLYLAGFRRWLGLDSSGSATSRDDPPCFAAGLQSEDLGGLTEMLMRDFMVLIPLLAPALLKQGQAAVRTGSGGAHEKETP
jgi:hypothetical protein